MHVYDGEGERLDQPDSIRFSALGVEFYAARPMSPCSLLEFNFDLPHPECTESVCCCGLVVDCAEEQTSRFRVLVRFMDLPSSAQERIHELARSSELRCPFCDPS